MFLQFNHISDNVFWDGRIPVIKYENEQLLLIKLLQGTKEPYENVSSFLTN